MDAELVDDAVPHDVLARKTFDVPSVSSVMSELCRHESVARRRADYSLAGWAGSATLISVTSYRMSPSETVIVS